MAKYFVTMHTGFCGEEAYDVVELDDSYTDSEVQDLAHSMALDSAEYFGRYPTEDCNGMDEDDLEACASDGIGGFAVPYDPEKHDMYSVNGKWD